MRNKELLMGNTEGQQPVALTAGKFRRREFYFLSSCRYNNLYPIEDMKFVKSDRGLVPHNVYSRVPLKYYNDLRLGEVDTSEFPIEETMAYVDRLIKLRA